MPCLDGHAKHRRATPCQTGTSPSLPRLPRRTPPNRAIPRAASTSLAVTASTRQHRPRLTLPCEAIARPAGTAAPMPDDALPRPAEMLPRPAQPCPDCQDGPCETLPIRAPTRRAQTAETDLAKRHRTKQFPDGRTTPYTTEPYADQHDGTMPRRPCNAMPRVVPAGRTDPRRDCRAARGDT